MRSTREHYYKKYTALLFKKPTKLTRMRNTPFRSRVKSSDLGNWTRRIGHGEHGRHGSFDRERPALKASGLFELAATR